MANKTIPQLTAIVQNTITGTELIPVAQSTADLKMQINQIPHDLIFGLDAGSVKHLTSAEKSNFTAAKVTTVGTGGDYATISAAITAGKKGNFLLLSNITEIANITFAANLYDIDFNSFTLSLGTFNIVSVANTYSLYKNGTITATNSIWQGNNNNCFYDFQNMVLTPGSTIFLLGYHSLTAFKTTFNYANIALGMVADGLHLSGAIFDYCIFNGGGASCSTLLSGIVATTCYQINNCVTTGTFNALAAYNCLNFKVRSGTVAKIQVFNTSGVPGVINNAVFPATILEMTDIATANYGSFVNSKFLSLTVVFTNYANVYFDNVEFLSTSKQTLSFSNLTAGSLLFNSDVDISGDNNIVSIMRIQTTGGAKLTLLAGADNNTISVLHTKAATVNSGANNTILIEKIV